MKKDSKADPKWKGFERLVAAIHKAADEGAIVNWNEKINGRQFDVTIRFQKGLYEYLTVVECRAYKKAVPVEKVEAFVTKSKGVHAHNAIMASSHGFQKGAIEEAKKHNITLLTVEEVMETNDWSLYGAKPAGFVDALNIRKIELEYESGERIELPEEGNALAYYTNHIIIKLGDIEQNLDGLLLDYQPNLLGGELEKFEKHTIDLKNGCEVIKPLNDEIPLEKIKKINLLAGMTKAQQYTGKYQFEPYLLMPNVKVENLLTGQVSTFSQHNLPLGIGTTLEEGKFYQNPQLASYYYCEKIGDNSITLYLVESYQCGQLLRAKMEIGKEHQNRYVEVNDNKVIRRLQKRLSGIKK